MRRGPRNSSSLGGNTFTSRISLWIAATTILVGAFFLFAMLSPSRHAPSKRPAQTGVLSPLAAFDSNVKCYQHIDSDNIPDNSRFLISTESKGYDVHKELKCWKADCTHSRNNRRAFAVESASRVTEAQEWNTLGVHAMERVVQGNLKEPVYYNSNSLKDAVRYFNQALAKDPTFATARLNLGLALAFNRSHEAADQEFETLLTRDQVNLTPKEIARAHVFAGLNREVWDRTKSSPKALEHYNQMREIDSETEREFWGIPMTASPRQELFQHGQQDQESSSLLDMVTWKWFGARSIARWALLDPGTQDAFAENRFVVLRRVLPPWILKSVAKCYRRLIDEGMLKLGDTQSQRYTAYNDRCSRFLHYELVDLVRRVIAHNARPSYTYFGGYTAGADLKPHNDRTQCEWTMSLQVEQNPHDKIWMLSLGKKPRWDRDINKAVGRSDEIPPEDEVVDADLSEGDALLFMGRQLVHFRKGNLPAGQWTNQVFLHYVPEDFTGSLN